MNSPLTGETVDIELVEVDDLEAKCLLRKYNLFGYINNENMSIAPHEVGKSGHAKVVNVENGRVHLQKL